MGDVQGRNGEMTEAEARECVESLKSDVDAVTRSLLSARQRCLALQQRAGWKALGYKSFRACIEAEFGQSRATIYRQIEAAKIELQLSHHETIPEAHLRPLSKLPEGERRGAWGEVLRLASVSGQKPTAEMVEHVVQQLIDEPYLAQFPIREHLSKACRGIFDRDAILWRDLHPYASKFKEGVLPVLLAGQAAELADGFRRNARDGYAGKVRDMLASAERHPSEWVLCPDCKGSGQVVLIGKCPECKGTGYKVWPLRHHQETR